MLYYELGPDNTIIKAVYTDDHGEPLFDGARREGAKRLFKAGYVERSEFKGAVQKQFKTGNVTGYFCANCEYHQLKSGTLHGSWCRKLKAEDAVWGCCNIWEYEPPKRDDDASSSSTSSESTSERD